MTGGKIGRNALKLLLALLALATGVVFAEGALRLSGRVPSRALRSVNQAQYDEIPGIWAPNQELIDRSIPELPHRVVTNALGLRGAETTLTPTKPRVLFIGDSFTFGSFVDNGETLVDRVQQHVGEDVEVLNGGVGGSTIVDQRVFLDRLLVLQPQVVVLVYSETDLDDLSSDPPLHLGLQRNRALKSGLLGPVYQCVRDTCLFSLFLKAKANIRARRADRVRADAGRAVADSDPKSPKLINLVEYVMAVREVKQKLDERNIGFVFSAYPLHRCLYDTTDLSTIPTVISALKSEGITGIDLTPALRASGLPTTELYLLPFDGHPTALGYKLAAPLIANAVREQLLEVKD